MTTAHAASSSDGLLTAASDLRSLGSRLEQRTDLDRIVQPVRERLSRLLPDGPRKDALQGSWLGHPVHPALTDLPIGFWTSALVLDVVGGRRGRTAADLMIALGVLTAIPTAATGAADWADMERPRQRTGIVHAGANTLATALYAMSFVRRRRGRRFRGFVLSTAGMGMATLGGYLGGHLAFGESGSSSEGRSDHAEVWSLARAPWDHPSRTGRA